jgi:hypothetical protein
LSGRVLERHTLRAQRTLGFGPEVEGVADDRLDGEPLLVYEMPLTDSPENQQCSDGHQNGLVGPELCACGAERRPGTHDIIDDSNAPPMDAGAEGDGQSVPRLEVISAIGEEALGDPGRRRVGMRD